jgi:hypothetical protein
VTKHGREIVVRAPIGGEVLATGSPDSGWYLKVRPQSPAGLRHLLRGPELSGWLNSELERLQIQLSDVSGVPTLADGGSLVRGLMDARPDGDWDAVLAAMFLVP